MNGLNGFKHFSETLPDAVFDKIKENNGFKYPCDWFINASFQRGDDFIVSTDDGGFYKVHAMYMVWTFINGEFGSQAIWSGKALRATLKSFMLEGKRTPDPNYHT